MKLTIPKATVPPNHAIELYFDSARKDFVQTETPTGYALEFTCTHSIHVAEIRFVPTPLQILTTAVTYIIVPIGAGLLGFILWLGARRKRSGRG